MENKVYDGVVAGFYRAATGEQPWSAALDGMQAAFGARAAVVQTVDRHSGRLLKLDIGGPQLNECVLNYVRDYHRIDPRRDHMLARAQTHMGQWWHCHETFDAGFVDGNRFYEQFLPAYDMRYLSVVMLQPADDLIACVALELPTARGVLSADERDLVRRLGVHVQDALRAHERVRALAAQAMAAHGLLDGFAYPMWLLDSDRFIHHANAAARLQTDVGARLLQRGARLLLTQARCDARLTERLTALSAAPHGATAMLDLRPKPSAAPGWLHVALLRPAQVTCAFGDRPLFLATLFDPAQAVTLDPYALGQVLGLTPAQARVAARLADGLSAAQIAAAHRTAVTTVRTQVRGVLACLGARRVSDAVRALRQGETLWAGAAERFQSGRQSRSPGSTA